MTRDELLSRLGRMEKECLESAEHWTEEAVEEYECGAADNAGTFAARAGRQALDALALSEARAALAEDRAVLILDELRAELYGRKFYTIGVDDWIVSKLAALKSPAPPTEEN